MELVVAPRPTGFQRQREKGRTEEGRMKRKYQSMKTCSREKIWRSSMKNSTHWRWKTDEEGAGG